MPRSVKYVVALAALAALGAWALRARGPESTEGPRAPGSQASAPAKTPAPPAAPGAPVNAPGGRPPRPAIPVKVVAVEERPLVEEVAFVAAVEPSVATTIGAEVEGRVAEMRVLEGDRVEAGKTAIARIDAGPREIQLREAQASVARAREELDKLRRGYREEEVEQRAAEMAEQKALMDRAAADFKRAERLHAEQIISLAELQRFQAEYLAAKQKHQRMDAAHRMMQAGPRPEEIAQAAADLAQAQARADRIVDEIRRTTIRAAITGYVVRKHVDVGVWLRPGDKVVDLIALDPVFITGAVGEREVPRLRSGQSAAVTVDAHPGRTFRGRVSAIVPGADVASRTFPVKVTVENPGGSLKAGMFARVAVRTGQGGKGLFLPKDAVVRRGGQEFVFLVNGDAASQIKVETGAEVGGLVEVRGGGLAVGQRAVTLGNEFLQPGMKVAPQ
jgi:multidrug efflux pump subunit AcrA (membrane-fusion protein)